MDFELLETLIKELNTILIVVTPLRCFIDIHNKYDNHTNYSNNVDKLTLLNSIINNIKGQIELLYPQHDTLIILCDKILFPQIHDSMSLAMTLLMHRHVIDIQHEYMTPISSDIDSFFNKDDYADSNILDRRTGTKPCNDYIDRFINEDGYISPIENDNDDYDESLDMHLMDRHDITFKQSLYSDDEGSFHSYISNYDD